MPTTEDKPNPDIHPDKDPTPAYGPWEMTPPTEHFVYVPYGMEMYCTARYIQPQWDNWVDVQDTFGHYIVDPVLARKERSDGRLPGVYEQFNLSYDPFRHRYYYEVSMDYAIKKRHELMRLREEAERYVKDSFEAHQRKVIMVSRLSTAIYPAEIGVNVRKDVVLDPPVAFHINDIPDYQHDLLTLQTLNRPSLGPIDVIEPEWEISPLNPYDPQLREMNAYCVKGMGTDIVGNRVDTTGHWRLATEEEIAAANSAFAAEQAAREQAAVNPSPDVPEPSRIYQVLRWRPGGAVPGGLNDAPPIPGAFRHQFPDGEEWAIRFQTFAEFEAATKDWKSVMFRGGILWVSDVGFGSS